MPSFDTVNYAIRPNKSVERKIAFSALSALTSIFNLSTYPYLGLGSIWFIDFFMAHKILGIEKLTSIEFPGGPSRRAEFNRPYSCITVVPGQTTEIIPTLNLKEKPSLIWFDYDSSVAGPVLEDIELLTTHCAPNSVILITLNADKKKLPKMDENGAEIDEEESLHQIAGDLVPNPLSPRALQYWNYPNLVSQILFNRFETTLQASGRAEKFVKFIDLVYADTSPLVTLGGVLATPEKIDAVLNLTQSPRWEAIISTPIRVPHLTAKEKIALDRVLPSLAAPTDAEMEAIGFPLEREQIDAYYKYYKYYPMFGEIQL